MYALKRLLPMFATAAGSSTFIIRTITTLRVSLPLIISPNCSLTRDTLFSPWLAVQSRGAKIKSMDLEAGDIFERKGRIFQVLKTKGSQQGKGGGASTIQVDLREIGGNKIVKKKIGGNKEEDKISEKFRSDEAFESVSVEDKSLTFLYTEGDFVTLMEPSTYEQTEVSKDFFGKSVAYLNDEMNVTLHFYDGTPMSASVPPLVTCTVTKENSHMEGRTAIPKYKSVLLDNGLTVQVPDFIEAGDKIVINTADHSYRSKEE